MTDIITPFFLMVSGVIVFIVAIMAYAAWRLIRRRRLGKPRGANILDVTRRLKATNAQWTTIMTTFNPHNNRHLHHWLIELRGPHMFTPHTALNIIEQACFSVLKDRPHATVKDVLRAACHSTHKVTRYGD